jgi:hypothetical protein
MEGTADADRAAGDPKAQLSGPTSFVSGRRGQGLYLPKGAACSYAVEGNLNLAAGTLAAWVCLDRDTASWDAQKGSWYQWLFGLRDGNGDQRSDLRVFFAQSLALQYATPRPKPTEGSSYVGDLKWPGKQWHHVAVTFRAHEIKLFVDGKPVGTPITNCDTLAAATGRILLGCSDESGQGSLGGVVDEFFVLSRALTDAEAYALYLTTGGVGDTTGLRPVGLAGMKPSATPPAWTDAFAKAGLADGVSEYVAFGPSAQAPGPALAARPDALFRAAPSSDDRGRSYALWLRFPSKSTTATSVPALNLSFREPSVATAACEVNEVNGRATLIVADDQRIFGGSPSTYRLAPAEWHHLVLVFRPDGMAEEYLDGVLQYRAQAGMMPRGLSEISLAPDSGALQEAMSYARALSPSEVAALFNYGASGLGVPAKVSAEERPYWDLTAAYHGTAGGVDRLCLNGLWRFLPADGMGVAPPLGRAWGYARVPGSFCAVHHFTAYDPAMKPIPNELWTDGRPFTHYFPNSYDAGWYERTVDIPADWKGRRLSLLFDRIGAYAARICINGRLAAHFEQTLPGEACLFPQRRIDVSAYAGQTVRVSVEVGWDDAGACDLYTLGDVWLTAESGWVDVESASPITKVRPDKTLSVSAILHNSGTAPVEVSAAARVRRSPSISIPARRRK